MEVVSNFFRCIFLLLFFSFVNPIFAKDKKDSAYSFYTKGTELSSKKKYAESVEKFEKAIEVNPSFLASYLESARSLVMLGKREAAMKKLDAAEKVIHRREELEKIAKERALLSELFYTNNSFQAYQNGLNFLRLERSNAALESLEKALALEPDNVAVLMAHAQALQAEDNARESIKSLEKAMAMNAGKRELRTMLAEAYLPSATQKSLELLKNYVKEKSASEAEVLVYVRALSLLEKNKLAIEFLQDKIEKNPQWMLGQFWLGRFYSQEPQGSWMARKYLMTFLKRTELKPVSKSIKQEAEGLLLRVNQALQ